MPEGFFTVPDWFSWENQGAGIAVADLAGERHLIVLMVDNPVGQNRGLFRVGRSLGADGQVTGGWTPWTEVPDWFPWENQGADLAVADLSGTGRQDLVVLMVDNPPGKNRGLYRIGRGLDADGTVSAGWSPWREIPDWFSWENQGCGAAVTPPDAGGRRDLVVFTIDNAAQANRGVFRVGRDLDDDGNVSGGWTPWIDVPDWFSWENQGAGIALADLDGDGGRDLLVFMIDAPVAAGPDGGQNQGLMRVGRDLAPDGSVTWDAGWSPLPHWFAWENAGGGIAAADLGGGLKLLALSVDAPVGRNEGLYQLVDLAADPVRVGLWDAPFAMGNVAIHAAVLPSGEVLFWGRRDDLTGTLDPHHCTTWLWDPATAASRPSGNQPTDIHNHSVNLFCAGHAFLPNGRLLAAGGHLADGDGPPSACLYDHAADLWTPLPDMNAGRWYPTVTALPDGDMLVIAGSFGHSTPNVVPQVWDGAGWRPVVDYFGLPLYPRMIVRPDGRVFMAGSNARTDTLDIGADAWTPGPVRGNNERQYAPAVPFRPGQVLYCGGGNDPNTNMPTANCEVIDLEAAAPAWRATAPMHFQRRQHNATILPDGTVLVTGGTMGTGFNDLDPGRPVHFAELWDPANERWRLLAAESVDRCYHSVAVLLPDGRVLSAGGGEFYDGNQPNDPKDTHADGQVFRPPYLFRGPRPVIHSAPDTVGYGESFAVGLSGPPAARVTWIRLPAVTHAFDQNQRFNELAFSPAAGGLDVIAPATPELCPPGHHMMFVLAADGTPSVARIIRIEAIAAPRRRLAVPAPAADAAAEAAAAKDPLADRDALVCRSQGTPVTIGLTARCPYGLGACWGGAYEALKKLEGVEAVRPLADGANSTAQVFLAHRGLPDLDRWPEQFAGWANRSYDFRGVEVTLHGRIAAGAEPALAGDEIPAPVRLRPLAETAKVQWDHRARQPRSATPQEAAAFAELMQATRTETLAATVIGPLHKAGETWTLFVREFRPEA